MICIENLRYRHLKIGHLSIGPGMTAVIGPNGSGKTSFLRLLAGIAVPESGSIRIDGVPPRDTEIGWVNEFPDKNILFGTVYDEVAASLRFRHLPDRRIADQAVRMMKCIGIHSLRNRQMQELSGGEKVLVALGAALITGPKVLVIDEFDSHLDICRAEELLCMLRKHALPYIIHCTQDMETAALADTVVFLEDGRAAFTGSPERVFPLLAGTPFFPLSWRAGR